MKRELAMPDRVKPILLMLGLIGLGACHNDPFSLKPEVNVTLPKDPPPDAAPAEQADDDAGLEAEQGS